MSETTHDEIDIKETLSGPISEVIANLKKLAKQYPDGTIEVTTTNEYGETYAAANLSFVRPKTALEIELSQWRNKTDALAQMKREAAAFQTNGVEYPRQAELDALRKELGFFAMSPRRATLIIYRDEILVQDMMRGARRRDGTFVLRAMHGSSAELEEMYEKADAEYVS